MGIRYPCKIIWGEVNIMSKQYLSLFWGLLYYYPMEDMSVLAVHCIKKVLTTATITTIERCQRLHYINL